MKKNFIVTIAMALVLMLGCACVGQAEIIPAYGPGQIGYSSVVLCEQLTLRSAPNSSASAIKSLPYGSHIIVMDQADGWAHCTLGDSEDSLQGWVNAAYIAVDPAWYRTEGKTAVYAWNSTNAPRVALLDVDTTVPILKDDGEWLVISLRGASGWIHK